MKQTLIALQVAVLLIVTGCRESDDSVLKEIESVKTQWVPDSRVALFDVEAQFISDQVILKGETTLGAAKAELIKRMQKQHVRFVDSIVVLPNALQKWAITSVSVANLRDKPKHSAQLVSQTIMGTPVQVLKADNGWSLIQSPDNYIAWVNNSSIVPMDDVLFSSWKNSERCMVLEDCWLLDDNGKRVSDLVKGTILQVDNESNKNHLLLPDGRRGTVNAGLTIGLKDWMINIHLNQKALVEQAVTYMGLPYLWGGTSSKAVDCSGFMKNIYFMNGFILARDASQQIKYGQTIELDIAALQVGDLLFFGNPESGSVTHVAMYIGDTEYIHSSGQVKVNSLDQSRDNYSHYRTSSWLGAQRYIGQQAGEGLMPVSMHSWYVDVN